MDVMIGAYGSSYLEEGAAHIVYGTNTSAAYEASFLDLGAADGGLDGIDGFTLTGIMMQFPIYAELVRQNLNTISITRQVHIASENGCGAYGNRPTCMFSHVTSGY